MNSSHLDDRPAVRLGERMRMRLRLSLNMRMRVCGRRPRLGAARLLLLRRHLAEHLREIDYIVVLKLHNISNNFLYTYIKINHCVIKLKSRVPFDKLYLGDTRWRACCVNTRQVLTEVGVKEMGVGCLVCSSCRRR